MGTLIGCLLLALVWWMVRNLGGGGPGYGKITVDDPALRRMAEESARAQARAQARLREKRYAQEASVPWVRNALLPEPAAVEVASQPFATRRAQRPDPASVYAARVPPIGKRYSLSSPDPVKLPLSVVPWTARRPGLPVMIEPARLPHLARLRDVHAPDQATLNTATVPWRNGPLAVPQGADLRTAAVPWMPVTAGQAHVLVVPAQVPAIRPKPDPAKPWPARVPEAQTPWSRNAARPLERHVYEAHLPSRLRALVPGGQ